MGQHTPLYDDHLAAGAKMVDFAGWDMPIHYGSQIEEHHQVRRDAGLFDVSHMVVVDLAGDKAKDFLRHILANDVAKLTQSGDAQGCASVAGGRMPGATKALYSCMLNQQGGVIDDLIVYYLDDSHYRMVVNAATRIKDLTWINQQAQAFGVEIRERDDLAMLAAQGPNARDKVHQALGSDIDAARELKPFFAVACGEWFVARTGYTGEDGYEIMLPETEASAVWQKLLAAGIKPTGLGARDTLRLEAGMNLYGQDMTEDTSPLISGLAWTVAMQDQEHPAERDFIGRAALEQQKAAGLKQKLVGLVLEQRGVLRAHQKVITAAGEGEITSGSFSPTLEQAIALARVPFGAQDRCQVEIRGKLLDARIVKYPFVRNGKACI